MRRLVVNMFLTLDGVMQAPDSPNDSSGGFPHAGWAIPYWDDAVQAWWRAAISPPFDLLLGRKTYEAYSGFAHATDEPDAEIYNNAKKYVVSRTLHHLAWQNSTLLEGDVGEAVARLKSEDGPEIQVQGSSKLVQTLLHEELVDEFGLLLHPLVLGTGKRLFADGTIPSSLRLVDSTTSPSGVLMTRHVREEPSARRSL